MRKEKKTYKMLYSSPMQIGPEETPLPPMATTWAEYEALSFLIKKVCAEVNSTLYFIDNGGCSGAEALAVLHEDIREAV